MECKEKINKILKADIRNTKIISVELEDSGMYDCNPKLVRFYKIVCESSYESGSLCYTQVWLPEDFNGVFVGLGNGGMAGAINHWDLLNHVRMGYAAACTDMGTSRGRNSGINNPAVWKDFGWRATHGMTELAKQLIELHYGKKPQYSYFIGGSTGGQQAFSLAQRYPHDYNGIIAGVPANNRVALHTYFLWNHVHLRSADGKVMFTDEEIQKLTACATEFFQGMGDGEKGDNFVTYPWSGDNTIADFIEFLEGRGFSEAQLKSLKAVYEGPCDPKTGEQIYNGMPIGSEIFGGGIKDCQGEESPHYYPFIWVFGENYNGHSFDFSNDYKRLRAALSEEMDANSTDLWAFKSNGGKLIAYSGSADPCVPYPDAVGYCERLMDSMGGYDKTAEFFRYFLFPGKDHGAGGLGANREWDNEEGTENLLDSLRLWCEKDKAPKSLVAARVEESGAVFTRRVYPYGSAQNPLKQHTKVCETF